MVMRWASGPLQPQLGVMGRGSGSRWVQKAATVRMQWEAPHITTSG